MNRTALLILGIAAAIPVALLVGRPHPAPKAILAHEVQALQAPRRTPAPLASPVIYIVGAVRRPGLYTLAASSRVAAALGAAGGPAPGADLAAINLAERVKDGAMIAVPKAGETRRPGGRAARTTRPLHPRPGASARASSRTRKTVPIAPLDLNSADAGELATLPGMSVNLAERIVRFRELNGPFGTLDDLADVAGMTPRRIDALSLYLEIR